MSGQPFQRTHPLRPQKMSAPLPRRIATLHPVILRKRLREFIKAYWLDRKRDTVKEPHFPLR
jgi:hypothetical protein